MIETLEIAARRAVKDPLVPTSSNDGPLVVAVGGTLRAGSTTEKALACVLREAERLGARTMLIPGPLLDLPMYAPERKERTEAAAALVAALRAADGILIGSPGYHGSLSGLVKNALDYTEDMRGDAKPYFAGRAVGCIATAAGAQGAVSTLTALRAVVHALRGWNTPLGMAINTTTPVFSPDGCCIDERVNAALKTMAQEVVDFARLHATASNRTAPQR